MWKTKSKSSNPAETSQYSRWIRKPRELEPRCSKKMHDNGDARLELPVGTVQAVKLEKI
jgi:hypothetical protein